MSEVVDRILRVGPLPQRRARSCTVGGYTQQVPCESEYSWQQRKRAWAHAVLQLAGNATEVDVRTAYRALSRCVQCWGMSFRRAQSHPLPPSPWVSLLPIILLLFYYYFLMIWLLFYFYFTFILHLV